MKSKEKIYILKGSDDDSYCIFGAFSSYEKAMENKQKLDKVDWITDTKVKTDIMEAETDDTYITDFMCHYGDKKKGGLI